MEEKITVLYVDDEPGLLELARIFLERSGNFQVATALSAKDALQAHDMVSYDLIISDYMMPEMDGIAFLKEVRKRYGDIPFILFTGRGREEVVIEAINNGADFYLQKGGDPAAQFAELAHKIRQAVARKRAERSLIESEKRLSDIINFLPDATFAIDKAGTVIAWNRAIEEMTGVSAAAMLGKGGHEYAIPFYGTRRKILIDLIFESDDDIAKNYAHILHEGDVLIADTTLPRPQGKSVTLMGKASPLYNRNGGVVGAIESIRDVTQRDQAAEQIARKTRALEIINRIIRATNLQQTIDEAAQTVLSLALDLLHYDAGGVYLVDDDRKTARIVCQENLDPAFIREVDNIDIRAPPYDALFLRGEPIYLEHFEQVLPQAAALSGLRSVASIPLVSQDTVIGALNVASRQRAVMSPDDREILVTIGKELGSVISRITTEFSFRKSEEKYRDIYEHSVAGLFKTAPDGRLLDANDAFARMFGYPDAAEMLALGLDVGKQLYADPADRDQFLSTIDRKGKVENYEARTLRRDGTPFWISIAARTIIGTDGTARFYEGSLIDISDRKRAEEQLRESEAKYRRIVETANEGIWILDHNLNTTFVNQRLADMLGYARDEMAGHNLMEYVLKEDRPILEAQIASRRAGARSRYECRLRHKNGRSLSTVISGSPLLDEAGGFQGSFGMVSDITELKQAESALRESEEKFRSLVETSPDMIWEIDTAGKFRYMSPTVRTIMGYTPEEVIGRSVLDLVPDAKKDAALRALKQAMAREGSFATFQVPARHRSGRDLILEIRPARLTGPDRKLKGLRGIAVDITERGRTEEALRESEKLFRGIFENSPSGIALALPDFRFFAVNPAFVAMTGYTENELLQLSFAGITHADDLAKDKANIANLVEGTLPVYSTEKRYIRKDGSILWGFIRVTLIRNSDGSLRYFVAQIDDISKRKQVEANLGESTERSRRILEEIPLPLAIVNNDGRVTFLNDRFIRVFGYTMDDLPTIGEWWLRAYPDEEVRGKVKVQWEEAVRRAGEEHADISPHEYRVTGKTGEERIVEISGIALSDGFLATFIDLTEQKRMVEALQESEEKYRTILEKASEAITIIQDGRHVYVNPRMNDLVGITTQDLIGQPFLEMIWPGDREMVSTRYRQRCAGEPVPEMYDFRMVGPGGKPRWVSVSIAKIQWQGRLATINMITDITDRKSMEHAIQEANRKLNLLNSITRHDIMNQLTMVQGFTVAAARKETDPQIATYLSRIDESSATIRRQIEFMKTYQELGVQSPGWFRLDETVAKAARKEVVLSGTCPGVEVFADPMLEKVFFNLFGNAMEHGGHVTRIGVSCETVPDGLVIRVEDDGNGVREGEKEKIFEKGFGKHTGLGLFLSKEILSITDITIRECGIPGKGAKFEIFVPTGRFRYVHR